MSAGDDLALRIFARGRTNTRMNLIPAAAKTANQIRSPYSRGLSLDAGTAFRGCRKGCLNIAVAASIENDELLPEPLRRGLYVSSLRFGFDAARIYEHGY